MVLKMKIFATVLFLLFAKFAIMSATLPDGDGSMIEATHGETITLSFPVNELEKVDTLKIFFKAEAKENTKLIAQCCFHNETCADVEEVPLQIGGGSVSLTLQHVNRTRDSGVYEAQFFTGKNFDEETIILVVNDPPLTTSSPGQTSSPKPANSDERQRLWILASPVLFCCVLFALGGIYFIIKYRKARCLQKKNIGEQNGKDYANAK